MCIPYIWRGENVQILPQFFADFGTFKPCNFGIAHDIENLKRNYLHYGIFVQDIGLVDLGAVCQFPLRTMHFCKKSQNCKNRDILPNRPICGPFIGTSPLLNRFFSDCRYVVP